MREIRDEFEARLRSTDPIPIEEPNNIKRIADALESIADSLKDLTQNNMLGY